ncbi:hypothetical protein G6F41_011968 [Rhizopus arrhizus]|nr:hypothetical protein G6F41_011968 [Rhizopus arrhizus]
MLSLAYINEQKPTSCVSPSTVTGWIKNNMSQAGIDTTKYQPHSIRSASSTKAVQLGFKIDDVKKHANWSLNSNTFEKYYYKPNHTDRISTAIGNSMVNNLSENNIISRVRTEATSIGVGTTCNTDVAIVRTEAFEEENIKICIQNIEASPEVDLCYTNDPNEPSLVCKSRIFGSPNSNKLYKFEQVLAEEAAKNTDKEDIILESDSQIVDFLNYIYRPTEEYIFDSRYKLVSVSDKDILSTIWKFTYKFDKKTPLGFSQWLSKQNIDLTSVEPERKISKTGKEIRARSRQLNVLDDTHYISVAENVLNILPSHHSKINDMKKDGYQIIGYCRKSVAETKNRASCLQRMINILYKRSLVNKVFVSPRSSTKQPFLKRDFEDEDDILSKLNDVHGNTKDFLEFLENNTKICVIAIDYAGLTTSITDLKKLLR